MISTSKTKLVVCLVAMLVLASSAQAARPGRHLAQAYAEANADARDGASVTSISSANSQGRPTSSIVSASGSGPGVVINCKQAASNGQHLTKECADACGAGWKSAPTCSKGAKVTSTDAQGCPWGYEGQSCAVRN